MELWQLLWQPLSADSQPIWEYIYIYPLLTSGCQIVAYRFLGLHGLMSLIRLQYTASKLTYCTRNNNVHCFRKMTTLYFLLFLCSTNLSEPSSPPAEREVFLVTVPKCLLTLDKQHFYWIKSSLLVRIVGLLVHICVWLGEPICLCNLFKGWSN